MSEKEKLKKKYEELSSEAQRLVGKVIKIEKEKKHMERPRFVNEEILEAIEECVK